MIFEYFKQFFFILHINLAGGGYSVLVCPLYAKLAGSSYIYCTDMTVSVFLSNCIFKKYFLKKNLLLYNFFWIIVFRTMATIEFIFKGHIRAVTNREFVGCCLQSRCTERVMASLSFSPSESLTAGGGPAHTGFWGYSTVILHYMYNNSYIEA